MSFQRMNEGYCEWGALKSVLSNIELGMKYKKCQYKVVIVPTALYGAEAWGMRNTKMRKVNVLELKCLRSLVGVSLMDRTRNKEVQRRTGIEKELASRVDQRVLRFVWTCGKKDEYLMARRVFMAEVSGARVRGRLRFG